jgi:hypothetical protein
MPILPVFSDLAFPPLVSLCLGGSSSFFPPERGIMSPKMHFTTKYAATNSLRAIAPSEQRNQHCVNQEQLSEMEDGQLATLAFLAFLAIFANR